MILGKAGHRAKWNNKTSCRRLQINIHFSKCTSSQFFLRSKSLQRGSVDPKFHVEGVPATNHSSSQKTRINVLSYGIRIWIDLSSILSVITRVTDRRTDGRTEFSSLYRVCITCSAVKTIKLHAISHRFSYR